MIWLEAECSRYEFFSDVVAQTQPDIGLIAIDEDPDKALELVSSVSESSPECAVLVVSSSNDGNLILRVLRAGAKEFLTQPVPRRGPAQRDRAHQRATFRPWREQAARESSHRRGGRGRRRGYHEPPRSTWAARWLRRNPTAWRWSIWISAWATPTSNWIAFPTTRWSDVAQNVTRLDFSLLKRSLTKHSSGMFLLPRPVQLEDASLVSPTDMQRVIGLMKASFSHLVLDLSKAYSAIDMIALEMATTILLVTQLDLPCLRNIVRLMASLGEMDGVADKVKIVVNRAGLDSGQITLKKAQETIGRDIFWQLPNDLSHDERGPQQRRPADRTGTESRHHPIDRRAGRGDRQRRNRRHSRRRRRAFRLGADSELLAQQGREVILSVHHVRAV